MKKQVKNPVLQTWTGLNEALMSMDDEAMLAALLKEELKGRCRVKFAQRIRGRLNKVRSVREQAELEGKLREG